MKEKVKIVFLIILFLLILVGIKILLDNQDKIFVQNQVENFINNETEENSINENVLEVNSENFEAEVLNSDKTVLIDFYADWCGPCKVLAPIINEVANENDSVKFVKINIDEAQVIANKYSVMSIPTLVVIKNGEEINRSVGIISKTEIINMVK